MDYQNLFEKFDNAGKLIVPGTEISFADIPWSKHPAFEGGGRAETYRCLRTDRRAIQLSSCGDCPGQKNRKSRS